MLVIVFLENTIQFNNQFTWRKGDKFLMRYGIDVSAVRTRKFANDL